MAKKKSSPRSAKRSAAGKPGNLAPRRARSGAVKGGAATVRSVNPPEPDSVLNTLTKSSPQAYLR